MGYVVDLSKMDDDDGIIFYGGPMYTSVAGPGDVTGDDIDDLLMGETFSLDPAHYPGGVYLVYGQNGDVSPLLHMNMSSFFSSDNQRGVLFTVDDVGIGENYFDDDSDISHQVTAAGDVNGDGINDFFITPSYTINRSPLSSFLIYGRESNSPFPPIFNLLGIGIEGNTDGVRLGSIDSPEILDRQPVGIGDVNNDGIDDFAISEPTTSCGNDLESGYGMVAVVYGRNSSNPFLPHYDLYKLFKNNGTDADAALFCGGMPYNTHFGYAVSGVGDATGDDIDDFLIGDPENRNEHGNSPKIGAAYLISGRNSTNPFSAFNFVTLPGKNATFHGLTAFYGQHKEEFMGSHVRGLGDVNGDGRPDFGMKGIGVSEEGLTYGYVVYGRDKTNPFPKSIRLSDLGATNNTDGFVLGGVRPENHIPLLGDINGDGINDLLTNANYRNSDGNVSSQAAAIYGRQLSNPFPPYMFMGEAKTASELNGAFMLTCAFEQLPSHYSMCYLLPEGVGDINNDGLDDYMVQGFSHKNISHTVTPYKCTACAAYLVYGVAEPAQQALPAGEYSNTLKDNAVNDAYLPDVASSLMLAMTLGVAANNLYQGVRNFVGSFYGEENSDMPEKEMNDFDRKWLSVQLDALLKEIRVLERDNADEDHWYLSALEDLKVEVQDLIAKSRFTADEVNNLVRSLEQLNEDYEIDDHFPVELDEQPRQMKKSEQPEKASPATAYGFFSSTYNALLPKPANQAPNRVAAAGQAFLQLRGMG